MNTIISLVGARPQFIKEAVIASEVHKTNAWNHILVHSGQHYDVNMSDLFFERGWVFQSWKANSGSARKV